MDSFISSKLEISREGYKGACVAVDLATGYMFVCCIITKTETIEKIVSIILEARAMTGSPTVQLAVQVDQGKEYDNESNRERLRLMNVFLQVCQRNDHRSNGKAERIVGLLEEACRVDLEFANLLGSFWYDSFRKTVMLYNVLSRKGKPSNYELVTNKKPPNFHKIPTSYILPFGCYAVVLTDGKLRTKLAPAGELAIYLGICLTDGHWGARVWLLKSRRVIVTTNFRADISYYPFRSRLQ